MANLRLLLFTHLAVAGATYAMTDRRAVDTQFVHDGYFQSTTTKVLAATIESVRKDQKLQVWSYKGTAKVEAKREWLWIFGAHEGLSVPAIVSYQLDLSKLSLADVSYDEHTKIVTVRLPNITIGDISFEPENATSINGRVLSWDNDQVEALRKLNYKNARRAMEEQAGQTGLVDTAKRQAQLSVARLFEIPLRIAGRPDVKVVATFAA